MFKESKHSTFKDINKNLTISQQTDWNLLPWSQIEKFVFSLQLRIYKVALKNSKEELHKLQSLLANSYAAKLFVVKQISELRTIELPNIHSFNSLNSAQKLHLALSVEVGSSTLPFNLRNELIGFYENAKNQLLYLALRPEWEAYSKNNNILRLLDRSAKLIMQSIIYDFNLWI